MSFTVYKSSAGSGKTFTLVKEYLKLALSYPLYPPQKYKHILAITFTNKAAAEMKGRIIKALKEIAENTSNNDLLNELIKETGISKEELTHKSLFVLHSILHNYSDFAIGTIDSFVQRIVRAFAFDLKLSSGYEIEMDEKQLLREVIDVLISRVGSDEQLTRALVEFTESKADDEKNWHIEEDLFEFSKNLLNDEGAINLEKLKKITVADFLLVRKKVNEKIIVFESTVKKYAEMACDQIDKNKIAVASFYYGNIGIGQYFTKLATGNLDRIEPNSYVTTTLTQDIWYSKKTSEDQREKIDNIKTGLTEIFNLIKNYYEENKSLYYLFKLINKNIYGLAVLNEIEKLLSEIKKQNNILHISEFNRIISKVVLSQPVPFIYERVGEKFNHLLVDEFQDTSVLQWQNLLPLLENSLAQDYASLLVGDGKQAIYRFRGGEVEQFTKLPEVLLSEKNKFNSDRVHLLKQKYAEKHLSKNYRSKKEVVEFNNSLFSVLAQKLAGKYIDVFNNHTQESKPDAKGAHVSIRFIADENDKVVEERLSRVHAEIMELLKDNFTLKDITILCRFNKEGNMIAEYLSSKGIAVLSPDSLLINNSVKVRFIVSMINYINNPINAIVRTELLQYMSDAGIISTDLHSLIVQAKNYSASQFDLLLKKQGIDFNHNLLAALPLYELVEKLIQIFKLNDRIDTYLKFFIDEVHSYIIKKDNSLHGFIFWWEKRKEKASVNAAYGTNAVSIMTIHASKGLEFPVVILPFASWKVKLSDNKWVELRHNEANPIETVLLPINNSLEKTAYANLYEEEKNKSLLDNINLLYVALTRAEERLCIIAGKPTKNPANVNNVTDMLCYYLQAENLWDENKFEYEFGSKAKHLEKQKQLQDVVKEKKIESANWRNILKIRSATSELWSNKKSTKKQDFGIIVHSALSKIYTHKDIPLVLTKFLNDGIISLLEKEELQIKLNRLLNHEKLKSFYGEGIFIRTEAEIISPTARSYRPDRVVLNGEQATLIDYKTGEPQPSHSKQIETYSKLLSEMGYKTIMRYLMYIDDEKIMEICP